nr:MAG TPA: hypothetical protein [Caudoviricetes sp.]
MHLTIKYNIINLGIKEFLKTSINSEDTYSSSNYYY